MQTSGFQETRSQGAHPTPEEQPRCRHYGRASILRWCPAVLAASQGGGGSCIAISRKPSTAEASSSKSSMAPSVWRRFRLSSRDVPTVGFLMLVTTRRAVRAERSRCGCKGAERGLQGSSQGYAQTNAGRPRRLQRHVAGALRESVRRVYKERDGTRPQYERHGFGGGHVPAIAEGDGGGREAQTDNDERQKRDRASNRAVG